MASGGYSTLYNVQYKATTPNLSHSCEQSHKEAREEPGMVVSDFSCHKVADEIVVYSHIAVYVSGTSALCTTLNSRLAIHN